VTLSSKFYMCIFIFIFIHNLSHNVLLFHCAFISHILYALTGFQIEVNKSTSEKTYPNLEQTYFLNALLRI
jgi:hypothetical protein